MDQLQIPHRYDKISLSMILLSVIVFTLETVPELAAYQELFHLLEKIFITFFTGEYLLRLWHAPRRKAFIFSFYGIIDLLSIIPYFLSLGFADLRWIRILRVLRVFRIFKLGRYISAIDRLKLAVQRVEAELLVFVMISFILIYLAAVGIYHFEKDAQPHHFKSIIHSLWFAVVTLTTVGYGDVFPVTGGGKFFTGIVLMLGLGLISVPSGLLASSFTEVFKEEKKDKLEDDLRR
ncbi:MAG TPA: ion transporter [Bacteriovoracaceae bacterium]|nr:ion transporter [Bacteriovoracaceae bacterium]